MRKKILITACNFLSTQSDWCKKYLLLLFDTYFRAIELIEWNSYFSKLFLWISTNSVRVIRSMKKMFVNSVENRWKSNNIRYSSEKRNFFFLVFLAQTLPTIFFEAISLAQRERKKTCCWSNILDSLLILLRLLFVEYTLRNVGVLFWKACEHFNSNSIRNFFVCLSLKHFSSLTRSFSIRGYF